MWKILPGDCLDTIRTIPPNLVHTVITSPPYYKQRDYGDPRQIGHENTVGEYVDKLVTVFEEVRKVLRDDGTLWVNLGDKILDGRVLGIPWSFAFLMQENRWRLCSEVIWHKPNPMPGSHSCRPTPSHEHVFLFSKTGANEYYFDHEGAKKTSEDGSQRYIRSVWTIPTANEHDAHFAVFPEKLVETCVRLTTSEKGACLACGRPFVREIERTRTATRPGKITKTTGDSTVDGNRDPLRHVTNTKTIGWHPSCKCEAGIPASTRPCVVLDPFAGSGTTLAVAISLGRSAIGCELNTDYIAMAERKIALAEQSRGFGI